MIKRYLPQFIKGKHSIIELEMKYVTPLENPSLMWSLKREHGEALLEVISPSPLKGERYYNYFLHHTFAFAQDQAIRDAKDDAARTARKSNMPIDEAALAAKIREIEGLKP